jgi:hypothetical protein
MRVFVVDGPPEGGAHDISSTGEAHADVKAQDVSDTAENKVGEIPPRGGLSVRDIPSPRDPALRETNRNL